MSVRASGYEVGHDVFLGVTGTRGAGAGSVRRGVSVSVSGSLVAVCPVARGLVSVLACVLSRC